MILVLDLCLFTLVSVHLDPRSLLGLTTLVAPYSPVTSSSDHLTMMLEKVATLDLPIQPQRWGKSPSYSTTLNKVPVTRVTYTHHSIPFSTPPLHPIFHSSNYRDTQHSVYSKHKMSTYPCSFPLQTPAFTYDALTSSPGIFFETLMHPATHSGSSHNALHSSSCTNSCTWTNCLSHGTPTRTPTGCGMQHNWRLLEPHPPKRVERIKEKMSAGQVKCQ